MRGLVELMYLSVSSLALFWRSPERWRRRYLGRQREPQTGAMVVGKAVGATIAAHFAGRLAREALSAREADDLCVPAEPPVVKGVTGRFIDVDIEEAVKIAKEAADGANVVILGANVAKQALEADLIDEVLVHLTPVLLGDGVRLFSRSGGSPIRLERTSVQETGQLTALRFRVRKDGSR